ncbi:MULTISPECIES: SufS family cysteine desulfurase [unclassified Facklamia]|uniref:SufS family cysteine desulfurase n=1 Tax=Aerococcaceae TaxID=186827 RepID=UPI0013BB0440|nr:MULTISPECIES: SufS family cysteine desulfurase [unclassified Facklamia]NEW64807.1 SufS family cysteine desulfurase [Facklamia sp. 252]NEW68129.1 SufS family cysteine desulfurase [Facklamia sp. 253]QQD64961.1 SufS family cysteine desulfurase [Aerococcaceae bacterium zg-252]
MDKAIHEQFPILHQAINGERLIYLDSAATTQKPEVVIQAMRHYYEQDNANIHRGVHTLAQRATQQYESVRQQIATFMNAEQADEIIFTSGTTASINFLSERLVAPYLTTDDVVVVTALEHHSNLVPWQEVTKKIGAQLQFMPLDNHYQADLTQLAQQEWVDKIKVIAIQHVSNVLGVEQPIQAISKWAHERGIIVLVDGAQAAAHLPLDVATWGVDAYCWSGHKVYGPTGVGVCYLAKRHHERCLPFFYGGEMIHFVGDRESNYKEAPWKFEGGTPPIAQVIGLGKAIEWLQTLNQVERLQHEQHVTQELYSRLVDMDGIDVYGYGENGIVSFNIVGVHPHDAATGYDMEGIAVRAGHHCAQPLMRLLGVNATLRASTALYTTKDDVEHFIVATQKIKEFFNGFK